MRKLLVLLLLCLSSLSARAFILDEDIFSHQPIDPLAPRDEWGVLHEGKSLNSTDLARRYPYRVAYYFKAGEQLVVQPAYVGAIQRDLKRLGYYCGPIDGFFSPELSEAIARMQKNYSLCVTGTFNDQVRRALRLP